MSQGHAHTTNRVAVLAAFALALLVLLTWNLSPAYAVNEVVRIGFFESEKYGYTGADGNLRGYDVQLSKTIGMYAGFDVDMRGFDNVHEMEDALRDGEVDALIDFLPNERREQEFIFTESPILEEQVSLYTRVADDAPASGDAEVLGELTIGYVANAGYLDYFQDYCASVDAAPKFMAFHDDLRMHAAMEHGETNACLTGSAVPTGFRVLVSLPPLGSYMMLRADDEALRIRIDAALGQLRGDDPDYLSNLYHSYVASRKRQMSPRTHLEREYLAAHPTLQVAVVRGAEPFVMLEDDGTLGGVIPDYYQALGERLGTTFGFALYDSTQDAIDAVARGEADVLGQYYGDIIIAENDGLYDTMEYGSTDCARLVKTDFDGKADTAAVTNRTAFLLAEQLDPNIQLKTYPNIEACYHALMDDEVEALVGSMAAVTWLVNQHTMRGVRLSIMSNVALGMRGAVSHDNRTLLFLLNKAIAVSDGALNEAVIENAVNGKTNLRTAIENLPLGFTVTVGLVLVTLVVLLVVALGLLARSSRERIALLNREMNADGLTGAGSRRFGAELLEHELQVFKRYGDGPMVAMFDVDHFKQKNDTYGHEYGDFVLKKVVDVLRDTLRKSDTIIRWGGDEFILVFPKVRGEEAGAGGPGAGGAERILERTVNAIRDASFMVGEKGEQITISVGASFFEADDEDITPVLRRCDEALYEAKRVRNAYRVYAG